VLFRSALVFKTLRTMADKLHFAGEGDASREPHEWTGAQVLSAGSVNGCVEAAKAFKKLYDGAGPPSPAVFVGGTRRGRPGGHAVVEVTGEDGRPFIVDTVLFESLKPQASEDEASGPRGVTLQTNGQDVNIRKTSGGYVVDRYEYGRLFQDDRRLGETEVYRSLDEALKTAGPGSFDQLRAAGIVKEERNGTFVGPEGETEYVYLKTPDEPFSGKDAERASSESGRREAAVKGAP
jgi:hypothetical protein